ncbi:hypothetical protein PRIPAC_90171 [Pristionchus pacificus]|nr:hypothetical protein PRIPAC_90171 [Pristionchus pacificus]
MNNYPNPLHYQHEPERSPIDSTMRQIEQRAADAKGMIEELLFLLDLQSKAPWPTMLEKMSSLGAEMSQLQSILHKTQQHGRDDSVQMLRAHLLVPQMLSMDIDQRLQEATQGRVHSFNHDLVPDYLRTKADTSHEQEEAAIEGDRTNKDVNAIVKQTIGLNRNVDSLVSGHLNADKAQIESLADNLPTFEASETARLVKAVCSGFGLERQRAPPPPPLQVTGGTGGLAGPLGGAPPPAPAVPQMGMGMGSGMHMQQPGMMHQQPHPQQQGVPQGGYPVHQNGMGGGMGGMQGGGGMMGGGVPGGPMGHPMQGGGGPAQPGMMMNPMNPMMRRPMTRSGSSRCDFVGLEPSPSPIPTSESRRPSQAVVNSVLQALHDEWNDRPRPQLVEAEAHMLSANSFDAVKWIELSGTGDRLALTVVFPWMLTTVRCGTDISLGQFKQELFDAVKKMSVVGYSMVPTDYVFCALTQSLGEKEDLFDEEVSVSWVLHSLTQPFPLLFLHIPDGHQQEKEIASTIGRAIGRPLSELELKLSDELKQARVELFLETEQAHMFRGSKGFEHFAFPEEIQAVNVGECAPKELINKIASAQLRYQLYFRSKEEEEKNVDNNNITVDVEFDVNYTPYALIAKAIANLETNYPSEWKNILESTNPNDYLLQLVAQKKFLTGNKRNLIMYAGVRTLLEDYRIPKFVVRRKSIVLEDYPVPEPMYRPSYVRAYESRCGTDEISRGSNEEDTMSLWEIDDFFQIRPISCTNLISSDPTMKVYAAFMVVVGNSVIARGRSGLTPAYNPRWVENSVSFTHLYMKDLPCSAILCISLVGVHESKQTKRKNEKQRRRDSIRVKDAKEVKEGILEDKEKKKKDEKKEDTCDEDDWDKEFEGFDRQPIGWVNMTIFDWKNELIQGMFHASLWPGAGPGSKRENHFVAIDGPCVSNPAKIKEVCRLVFDTPVRKKKVVPPTDTLFDNFLQTQYKYGAPKRPNVQPKSSPSYGRLEEVLRRHQLGERMTEEEEEFVWEMRTSIQSNCPSALILLVDNGFTWKQRENFADLYDLLMKWPTLDIGSAFSLLDNRYMDARIREMVVSQIAEQLDNSIFPLYILPMIQALKQEQRCTSALSSLLLKRALQDYRIGQKLFWLLRSELSNLEHVYEKQIQYRLILILEAYLRGNSEHLKMIVKQVEMVERLTTISVTVKAYSDKDTATKRLREELRSQQSAVQKMDCPLDPTAFLGELEIDECRVLGSAKMPLRLRWKNTAALASHFNPFFEILFKNGDDLRQDMLVLQMLEVMDSIWKKHKLDCCLCVYPVLPMGTKIGMIGVVQKCSTIMEVQNTHLKIPKLTRSIKTFDTNSVNLFLRTEFPCVKDYLESVDRFLMSCVAYSVATYVMGVKDRHNDNIMMTTDGRLFHIDFGHFLGHGKSKLGYQRDRAPFVLTEHIVNVIVKGSKNGRDAHEMTKFKQLTVDAYAYLWENRTLFISLFSMMRSMRLPELSTDADLDYLKYALCVHTNDRAQAESFFSQVFDDALKSSWSTKTNWFFHSVKHA